MKKVQNKNIKRKLIKPKMSFIRLFGGKFYKINTFILLNYMLVLS